MRTRVCVCECMRCTGRRGGVTQSGSWHFTRPNRMSFHLLTRGGPRTPVQTSSFSSNFKLQFIATHTHTPTPPPPPHTHSVRDIAMGNEGEGMFYSFLNEHAYLEPWVGESGAGGVVTVGRGMTARAHTHTSHTQITHTHRWSESSVCVCVCVHTHMCACMCV